MEKNIPMLMLKSDYDAVEIGNLRTKIETFIGAMEKG